MTEITRSGMYEQMVQDIIENDELLYMLRALNAKVVCVVSDNVKVDESKRRVYAEIEKIPAKYESFINADAMIIIYTLNIASFDKKKKEIVLLRELLKLCIDETEGKRKVSIGDYDIKDFRCIVQRYGANWDQEATLFDGVEECQEVAECDMDMQHSLEELWKSIRENDINYFDLSQVHGFAKCLAEEAVQVAAVCERFMETTQPAKEKEQAPIYREDKTFL